LARAWVELPPGKTSELYQDFLDHNELGLAMEILAEGGDEQQASPKFWSALADAAREMQRSADAHSYMERAIDSQ
jgi:hypothetical protein